MQPRKMTAGEIVHTALIWGEESMEQMIAGTDKDDPYHAQVKSELKQLRAYRKRRFGERPDPTAGCKLVSALEIRNQNKS